MFDLLGGSREKIQFFSKTESSLTKKLRSLETWNKAEWFSWMRLNVAAAGFFLASWDG